VLCRVKGDLRQVKGDLIRLARELPGRFVSVRLRWVGFGLGLVRCGAVGWDAFLVWCG
jgi:hypothetical protein